MKKVLVVILSILLTFSLVACDKATKDNDSKISDTSQASKATDFTSITNESDNVNNNSSSGLTQSDNNNNSKNKLTQSSSSKDTVTSSSNQSTQNNSSKNNAATSSNNTVSNNTTSENIDNGVLEKVTSQKMNVPENMKLLSTNNAKEENNSKTIKATAGLYQLDGDVVNWTTENDLIYVITSANNRLVIID